MKQPTKEERRAEAQRLLAGVRAHYVAERMGVSDATIGAWRRGDAQRAPDLGDLIALSIAVERPLSRELADRVSAMLDASQLRIRVVPDDVEVADSEDPDPPSDVIDAAAEEAREVARQTRRRSARRGSSAGARSAAGE